VFGFAKALRATQNRSRAGSQDNKEARGCILNQTGKAKKGNPGLRRSSMATKDPAELRNVLQKLHDQGVIDLNAPLKDVVPVLEKEFRIFRQKLSRPHGKTGMKTDKVLKKPGYILVGDRSWLKYPDEYEDR
jgi:hypothetical protein